MSKVRALLAPFATGWSRKEWEGAVIACAAVALWFFQRGAKWPRWSGGWMLRSLFVYVLIPFAIHAYFSLENARRRYAALVLSALGAGALVARFVLPHASPIAWPILAAGVALSVPLAFFCDPRELGVRPGEARLWLPLVLAGWLVTLAGIFAIAPTASFHKSYPYVPFVAGHAGTFAFREALELVDMFSWEFFFRGFLLFGLGRRFGTLAVFVQMVPFVMTHYPKSEVETLLAIPGGLLLGVLAWRGETFLGTWILHWLAATAVNVFASIGRG